MLSAEYEIRLYEPASTRPLFFSRAASSGAAQAMARRWQAARPDCLVRVISTLAPRPRSLLGRELVGN